MTHTLTYLDNTTIIVFENGITTIVDMNLAGWDLVVGGTYKLYPHLTFRRAMAEYGIKVVRVWLSGVVNVSLNAPPEP